MIHRVSIPGRYSLNEYEESGDGESITGRLWPLVPKDIRDWIEEQGEQGQHINVIAPKKTFHRELFSNSAAFPPWFPFDYDATVTYEFADADTAMLFKLTFGGQ